MSYDESDALYEQGMDDLYEQFKIQYKDEFIHEKINEFYISNPEIVKYSLQNLSEAKILFEKEFYTSAFIHAVISIETGIKSVVLKPILYSLAFDNKASDLLYKQTFKQKSLLYIDKFYYDILKELTGLNFEKKTRNDNKLTIWKEWAYIQNLRNNVMHQGIGIERNDSKDSIDMACYICEEIIPIVLDNFYKHIKNYAIQHGSRAYVAREMNRAVKHSPSSLL